MENFKIVNDDGEVIGDSSNHVVKSKAQVEAAKNYSEMKDEHIKALEMLVDYRSEKLITTDDAAEIIAAEEERKKSGTYTQYFREIISDDPAVVARFFLMCTYLDFGSEALIYKKRPMTKSDLRRALKLKEDAFLEFYNEMEINDIIYTEDGYIKVNPKYCMRGQADLKNFAIIRCFDKPIRKLFESVTPRKHKHIGYIMMLLPYMNKYTNFLCKVVDLNDEDELEATIYNKSDDDLVYLSMRDICEMLEYNVDNMARLRRELCSIKIDGEYLFAFALNGDKNYYPIVNDVFFFGCDWKRKTVVHKSLFKVKTKSRK